MRMLDAAIRAVECCYGLNGMPIDDCADCPYMEDPHCLDHMSSNVYMLLLAMQEGTSTCESICIMHAYKNLNAGVPATEEEE